MYRDAPFISVGMTVQILCATTWCSQVTSLPNGKPPSRKGRTTLTWDDQTARHLCCGRSQNAGGVRTSGSSVSELTRAGPEQLAEKQDEG
eukprot:5735115-Amphidinium_carterae.1